MTPSNIVTKRVFVQETAAVYQQSKWTIYVWWLTLGTLGGALAGFMFSPRLASPWWLLPAYVAAVYALKRATTKLAQWVFSPEFWWQVTSFFLTSFLLACLVCIASLTTSSPLIGLPIIVAVSYVIGYFHTLFRVVYVRHQIRWYFTAPMLAIAATVIGWSLLPGSNASSTAIAGAVTGFLYSLLTTGLLMLMWDASFAQSYMGTRYVDQEEEFEEGLALHDSAISLSPNDPKLYAARADIYLRRGDVDRARADIDHALSIDRNCAEARVLRANLTAESGNLDEAIAEYDQLVSYKWGFCTAYLHRARAHAQKGELERAFDDYARAAKLGEDPAMSLAYRAETYYHLGNYKEAIDDCERILANQTMTCVTYAMAKVTRGKCYAATGEEKRAVADWYAVLQQTKVPAVVKEAEDALNAIGEEARLSLFSGSQEVNESES